MRRGAEVLNCTRFGRYSGVGVTSEVAVRYRQQGALSDYIRAKPEQHAMMHEYGRKMAGRLIWFDL